MQVHVILERPDAAALADLDRHRAAHDVARREVLGVRRVALHETLARRVSEVAALAAHALGDEHARAVDAGRVKLHELHVLQRQPRAQHHGVAVARADVRGRAREIGAAIAARREDHDLRAEAVQTPFGQVERDDAAADAVLHDEVDREELDVELGFVLERLLIERVQHRVARAVRGRAGALGGALAEVRRHAAEGPLVDAPFLRARERHAVMLELDDRGRGLLAQVLDRVLVAEPVRALDGVVHVPAPVVLAHVAECGADAALRRDRMAARGKHLADTGRRETLLGEAERGPETRAARADDDHVVGVIDECVLGGHDTAPKEIFAMEYTPMTTTAKCANAESASSSVLPMRPCT